MVQERASDTSEVTVYCFQFSSYQNTQNSFLLKFKIQQRVVDLIHRPGLCKRHRVKISIKAKINVKSEGVVALHWDFLHAFYFPQDIQYPLVLLLKVVVKPYWDAPQRQCFLVVIRYVFLTFFTGF